MTFKHKSRFISLIPITFAILRRRTQSLCGCPDGILYFNFERHLHCPLHGHMSTNRTELLVLLLSSLVFPSSAMLPSVKGRLIQLNHSIMCIYI